MFREWPPAGRPVGVATPPPPRSRAPPAGTEFTMGARPQPRGAGVGTRKLGNIIGPPFSKFSNFKPNHRPGTTTLKTLKVVGFRLCSMLSKCCPRRRPWGAATGDTASQRQQPSRREQGRRPHGPQAKGGRLEKNAMRSHNLGHNFKGLPPANWGGDPTPTAKFRTPPRRDGVRDGSIAAPRLAGVGI